MAARDALYRVNPATDLQRMIMDYEPEDPGTP
jgi:hypothetical protein